jgi:hypothetical protein
MLSSESVAEGMAILASAFRRRLSGEMTLVYHRVLSRHLHEDQFEDAVNAVLENEKTFPSVATVLMYGRASSRHRHEAGTAYVGDVPLRDYAEWVADRSRPSPPWDRLFKSDVERLMYEDAAVTERGGYNPARALEGGGEHGALAYIERICAKAEGERIRLREFEDRRSR